MRIHNLAAPVQSTVVFAVLLALLCALPVRVGATVLEPAPSKSPPAAKANKSRAFGPRDPAIYRPGPAPPPKQIKIRVPVFEEEPGPFDFQRYFSRKSNEIRRCYEASLCLEASPKSKVVVDCTVGTEGRVTDVTVTGAGAALSQCIQIVFQKSKGLPLLPAPIHVKQVYVFSEGDSPFCPRDVPRELPNQDPVAEFQPFTAADSPLVRGARLAAVTAVQAHMSNIVKCMRPVGAEPLLVRPVRASVDAQGRLVALELWRQKATDAERLCVAGLAGATTATQAAVQSEFVTLVQTRDFVEGYPTVAGVTQPAAEPVRAYQGRESCGQGPKFANQLRQWQQRGIPSGAQLPGPSALHYALSMVPALGSPSAAANAEAWQRHGMAVGEPLFLIAYGFAVQASQPTKAAEAYAAALALAAGKPGLRRFVAHLLESTGPAGMPQALAEYEKATAQQPSDVTGFHVHALALARAGQYAAAMQVLQNSIQAAPEADAAFVVARWARDAMALVGAAWIAAEPAMADTARNILKQYAISVPKGPALRLLLTGQTRDTSIELHVVDGHLALTDPNAHALAVDGRLLEEETRFIQSQWYAIDTPRAYPYRVHIHVCGRSSTEYNPGRLLVLRWDGQRLWFADRPFVGVLPDESIDLGTIGAIVGAP